MSTVITALHVLVCLFLMLTVLLQQGKGGSMGGAFGGSNAGTVFGGAGASTFLRRLTAGAAVVFMLTSMILAYLASANAGDSLEKFSNAEAKRRKQQKEADLRLYGDAGVTPDPVDAGAASIDPTPVDPNGAVAPTPAAGAEVPAEIPAPAAPTPAPAAAPTPTPAPAAPTPAPAAPTPAPQ